MNDDQFDDLKQYIAATVSQSEGRIRQELGGRIDGFEASLNQRIDDLAQEMRDGFAGVGDAFAPANDQLEDHEARITTLEQSAA